MLTCSQADLVEEFTSLSINEDDFESGWRTKLTKWKLWVNSKVDAFFRCNFSDYLSIYTQAHLHTSPRSPLRSLFNSKNWQILLTSFSISKENKKTNISRCMACVSIDFFISWSRNFFRFFSCIGTIPCVIRETHLGLTLISFSFV